MAIVRVNFRKSLGKGKKKPSAFKKKLQSLSKGNVKQKSSRVYSVRKKG